MKEKHKTRMDLCDLVSVTEIARKQRILKEKHRTHTNSLGLVNVTEIARE